MCSFYFQQIINSATEMDQPERGWVWKTIKKIENDWIKRDVWNNEISTHLIQAFTQAYYYRI